jgi:hypothetical protein
MSFSPKTPTDEEYFAFNYGRILPAGVTIVSAEFFMTVIDGVDANPSAMLSGAPVIVGLKVFQRVIGGVDGVKYCLKCRATTSESPAQKIELHDDFRVELACAA